MRKILFKGAILTLISFFIFTPKSFAQEDMDFEEFMGTVSESFTEKQLDEISFVVPWDVKVTAYAHGDFSGDGIEDIVLAIREKEVTPKNTVDIYFIKGNPDNTYSKVSKKNVKYYELTIEVAFMVKDDLCYVTNRDGNNWYFTSYKIKSSKLEQVSKETFPIEFEKAGEN